jgi:glutathione synthase/RimK-type ligase-like ATP-grasp enzyme
MSKVAVHDSQDRFTRKIVDSLKRRGVDYTTVDCYSHDILSRVQGCDILIWIWSLDTPEAFRFAPKLIYALQMKGLKVFPDFRASALYDDKIAQKYFLDALGVESAVKSYIFFRERDAMEWIATARFPKVFKLSAGAGSNAVSLCRSAKEAETLVKRAFGRGFPIFDRAEWFRDSLRKFRKEPSMAALEALSRAFVRLFIPTARERLFGRERGYLYFQDFIPGNDFDIRVIVVGERAVAIKRVCREGDFRASGSGTILYGHKEIPREALRISFEISEKSDFLCMAYDYVFDESKALLVEMSYHFSATAYDECDGYWDRELRWHDARVDIQDMIVEALLGKS